MSLFDFLHHNSLPQVASDYNGITGNGPLTSGPDLDEYPSPTLPPELKRKRKEVISAGSSIPGPIDNDELIQEAAQRAMKPPELPPQPSIWRQVAGAVASSPFGLGIGRSLAPLIEYGPSGLKKLNEYDRWKQNTPDQLTAAQVLTAQERERNQAAANTITRQQMDEDRRRKESESLYGKGAIGMDMGGGTADLGPTPTQLPTTSPVGPPAPPPVQAPVLPPQMGGRAPFPQGGVRPMPQSANQQLMAPTMGGDGQITQWPKSPALPQPPMITQDSVQAPPQLPSTIQTPKVNLPPRAGYIPAGPDPMSGQQMQIPTLPEVGRQQREAVKTAWPIVTPGIANIVPELGLTIGQPLDPETHKGLMEIAKEKAKNPKLRFEDHVDEPTGDVTTLGFDSETGAVKSSSVVRGIARKRPPVTNIVNQAANDPAQIEGIVNGMVDSPDTYHELPPAIKATVGPAWTAKTGLPVPIKIDSDLLKREGASRVALSNLEHVRELMADPAISKRLGPLLGRLGSAEEAVGATQSMIQGVSPEESRKIQQFRLALTYLFLIEGKSLFGGRPPQQLMSILKQSSPNVKMALPLLNGALDQVESTAQGTIDTAKDARFGGKKSTKGTQTPKVKTLDGKSMDYSSLAVGTHYLDPQGNERVK